MNNSYVNGLCISMQYIVRLNIRQFGKVDNNWLVRTSVAGADRVIGTIYVDSY